METPKLNFRNITLSGKVATGTSTLLEGLKPYLAPLGWKSFAGGEFMRNYAVKQGLFPKDSKMHHTAAVYSDEFDRKVDHGMKERLKKENKLMLESWLSGFMAQGIPGVLKILLTCSHDALIVDRIVNRDKVSIEEAKEHMKKREEENLKKWRRLYGNHDFYDPKLYDLVIDTYSSGPHETLGKVLDKLGYPVNQRK